MECTKRDFLQTGEKKNEKYEFHEFINSKKTSKTSSSSAQNLINYCCHYYYGVNRTNSNQARPID